MTEGSVTEWKVAVGEPFKAGDVLLSIETDKAAIDVEAMDDGVMGKILVSPAPPCALGGMRRGRSLVDEKAGLGEQMV